MFPDEITLTIDTKPYKLSRINQDNYGSEYRFRGPDDQVGLKIRHSTDSVDKDAIKMERHNVFVEHITYATPTANMKKASYTTTIRIGDKNAPKLGADLSKAVIAWLGTGTVIDDLTVGKN